MSYEDDPRMNQTGSGYYRLGATDTCMVAADTNKVLTGSGGFSPKNETRSPL